MPYSAEFDRAFEVLIGLEGGYVNDPADPGGETIFGISRRSHPDWTMWTDIDAMKKLERPMEEWPMDAILASAKDIYHSRYWKRVHGDVMAPRNFAVALEFFESCVNVGPKTVAQWIQVAANCFVSEGSELVVDGLFGKKTVALVLKLLEDEKVAKTFKMSLNCLQGYHYISLVTQKPQLRRFFLGWLNHRVAL